MIIHADRDPIQVTLDDQEELDALLGRVHAGLRASARDEGVSDYELRVCSNCGREHVRVRVPRRRAEVPCCCGLGPMRFMVFDLAPVPQPRHYRAADEEATR